MSKNANFDFLPVILRPKEAAHYLGMGRTKLHELHETDPSFPRKIHFATRTVGWRREDLDRWIEQKAKQAARKS